MQLKDRIARLGKNANTTGRLITVLNFYLTGGEWFAAHPKIDYCDDSTMAQLYEGWPGFDDRVRASRRTEWNTIREVAQANLDLFREIINQSGSKREFLALVTHAKHKIRKAAA